MGKYWRRKKVSKTRLDKNIEFYWARNIPLKPIKENHFNITGEGYIQSQFSEKYTLEAKADDKLIINQWKNKDQEKVSNTIKLKKT